MLPGEVVASDLDLVAVDLAADHHVGAVVDGADESFLPALEDTVDVQIDARGWRVGSLDEACTRTKYVPLVVLDDVVVLVAIW